MQPFDGMHLLMVYCQTQRVLRANAMENKVKVFHKRSDELRVGVRLSLILELIYW